jgi:hypothetical protein
MSLEKKKNLGIKRETTDRILKEMVETPEKINSSPETQIMILCQKSWFSGDI